MKIEGYSDYSISKCGKVKSRRSKRERVLSTPNDNYGYSGVALYQTDSNKRKSFRVHRLIEDIEGDK